MRYKLLIIYLIIFGAWLNAYTIDVRINSANSDAEERLDDNSMYMNSSDIELVFDDNREQKVGMRFENIQIPQNATITNAYIQFTVDEIDSGETNVVIVGEASSDPLIYSNTNSNITNRVETTHSVEWSSIPPWTMIDEAGDDQKTPSLVDIVQEIIDQTGWQSGNAMAFMIKAGNNCSDMSCQRTAESYNGDSDRAPLLHIEFTTPPQPFTSPKADYWFDECFWDGTDSQIEDHSGNDLHGRSRSGTTPSSMTTSSGGLIERAGDFTTDNSEDYIELDANAIDGLGDFTISLWFKTSSASTGSVQTFFDSQQKDKPQDEDWDATELRVSNDNKIVVNLGDQPYYYVDMPSGVDLLDNSWHQLVWTRTTTSGDNNCIYVDGTLVECMNRTFVSTLNISYFEMGQEMDGVADSGGYFDPNQNFEGVMDEVKIYSTQLSMMEISDIYDNESAGKNYDGSTRTHKDCLKAYSDYLSTDMDLSVSGNVLDNDTGDSNSVESNTSPSHGSLSGVDADGDFTYRPDSGYSGEDSFEYTITNGSGDRSTATVYIYVVDPNLIAEYRFDMCGVDHTAGDIIDHTINSLDGTSYGDSAISSGQVCSSIELDGSGDYIEVDHDDKFNFGKSFTISFWVYLTDDTGVLIDKIDKSNNRGWGFEISSKREIDFNYNGTSVQLTSSKLKEDRWHHIVGVYSSVIFGFGTKLKIYIDGNLDISSTYWSKSLDNATSRPLRIGWDSDMNDYYQGNLDEVKIWSKALTSSEISDIYDNESAGRDWDNDTDSRVCSTCNCTSIANDGMLVSFAADFRNMSSGKDVNTMLSPYFTGAYGSDWKLWSRTYDISTSNDASYHALTSTEDLEYGKAYWLINYTASDIVYSATLKTMRYDATIDSYPSCRSANGKCALVDLVEPNGTDLHGPYIYTMTSFPITRSINWKDVRVLIDGKSYTPDEAGALSETFNATIWRYDQNGKNYTSVTTDTPGTPNSIDPCRGYWIELDKKSAGKDVKLLIPEI
jgi:hypothetical protein